MAKTSFIKTDKSFIYIFPAPEILTFLAIWEWGFLEAVSYNQKDMYIIFKLMYLGTRNLFAKLSSDIVALIFHKKQNSLVGSFLNS